MPSNRQTVQHLYDGGWATDFGPNATVVIQDGVVRIPFLRNAEDMLYELDGGPRKVFGAVKLNSSQMASGAAVRGLFDCIFQGTVGSPTQHRIVHVDTTIKEDDADGTFVNLFTGLSDSSVPHYTLFEDTLIICSTADVPKSWDGTTAQNLAGTPPNISFTTVHKNRLWGAGDFSNPSKVYYWNANDVTSGEAGSLSIDPNDGDIVTGLVSHNDELIVFKGPTRGSIYRISGSSPTGTDAFALRPVIRHAVGAIWQNSIFQFGNDVGFLSTDGTIRSLSATAAYGDYAPATLSRPINRWLRENLTFSQLRKVWTSVSDSYGIVLFTIPVYGSTTNNATLMMDYRFSPVRWALWPSYDMASLAMVQDAANNNRRTLMYGGYDGYVRKLEQPNRSIDNATAFAMKVTTPFMDYGAAHIMKTLEEVGLQFQPKNSGSVTFGWTRDGQAEQTASVAQGGSDVLGASSGGDEFTLDSSQLGGSNFTLRWFETDTGGEFRAISFEVRDTDLDEDVELHGLVATYAIGADSRENTL